MQRTTTLTIAVAVGLMSAACQPPAGEGDGRTAAVDTAAVLAEVDSLRAAYARAVAEGDWQRLGTLITEGALLVRAGGAAWDSMFAASQTPFPPGASLEIHPHETRVLAREWVYEIGRGELTWTPEGADEPRTLGSTYMVLLHRTDEGWKLHREVESSRLLPVSGE